MFSAGKSNLRGTIRIQLMLPNGQRHSYYIIDKNTNYSTTSTEWGLPEVDSTKANYDITLAYDQIDIALADMCFSNVMISLSV